MRRLTRGTKAASILAGATVLSMATPVGAFALTTASGTAGTTAPAVVATTSTRTLASETRLALVQQRYLATFQARLDHLTAYVKALRAKVDSVALDTKLGPLQHERTLKGLAFVTGLQTYLAHLPETGMFAPTASQQEQIAALQASLAHIAGRMMAILDNGVAVPVVKPIVKTVAVERAVKSRFDGRRFFRFGSWDGHCDGDHDRDRRSWDGWDGDRWH